MAGNVVEGAFASGKSVTDGSMTGHAPTLPEIFALHAKWRANRPALVYDGVEYSWAQFMARANCIAHALIASGAQRGDIIAVQMQNSREMAESLVGIAVAGCVSAPLNLSVTDAAIEAMLTDAEAKGMIATADQARRMANSDVVQALPLRVASEGKVEGWRAFEAWIHDRPETTPDVQLQPDDPFNIIYSSGTTGRPKGILHTHATRRDWAYDLGIALRYHGASRTICTLGLYSNIAWVQLLCTWIAGGAIFLTRKFDAQAALQQIGDDHITHTAMVPVQFQRMLDHPAAKDADLSSMQAMMSCGSPLHEELKARIFERFDCGIIELYGLTEGVITTLEPEEAEGRLASVGKPLIGTDLVLLDNDDQPCPAGEPGEIVMRGRIVMPGYYNRPDANEEARYVDEAGRVWIRTGDIGMLDEEGYLYIVDRKKDMILSGGQNIYPADIEAAIVEHEQVRDCAVIGAKSRSWGESPVAYVEPVPGTDVDKAALTEWINEHVGKRQRIRDLVLIDEIPRNPNGKILKRELREMYGKELP